MMPGTEDLWQTALLKLPPEDRTKLSSATDARPKILADLKAIVQEKQHISVGKRWKFVNRKGKVIVIRDLFEKLARSVKQFAEVVDVAVQFDPVHAALPWAGVRFLLELAIGDVETWGFMVEGIERVAHVIARYTIVEGIFASRNSGLPAQLAAIMTDLYVAILEYLIRSNVYFAKGVASRHVLSVFKVTTLDITDKLDSIFQKDQEAQALLNLLEIENSSITQEKLLSRMSNLSQLESAIHDLKDKSDNAKSNIKASQSQNHSDTTARLDDITNKLREMHIAFHKPLVRMMSQYDQEDDYLNKNLRSEVLQWLSKVPNRRHHKGLTQDLLPGTGAWLEENETFVDWRNSSSSAVMWLHGIAGSGKSKVVAHVTNLLQNHAKNVPNAAPLGYFYCARAAAEPERADPAAILRCLLRQISCSTPAEPIPTLILDKFKEKQLDAEQDGTELELLTLRECVDLIIEFAARSALTILVDALDECRPDLRHLLLQGLESIVAKSDNVVKIFISSRDDVDIVMRLADIPNVYITASENAADIQRFATARVEDAIEQRTLLQGNVSEELRERIISTLTARAQGMFLSVTLQIEALCDHQKVQLVDDVLEELNKSPKTLQELWSEAMNRLMAMGSASRHAALTVIYWIYHAQIVLPCSEVLMAIRKMSQMELNETNILGLSNQLVIRDAQMDTYRFAHLSVREFLETTDQFSNQRSQADMALFCLEQTNEEIINSTPTSKNKTIDSHVTYASLHWPIHSHLTPHISTNAKLSSTLKALLSSSESSRQAFKSWLGSVSSLPTRVLKESFRDRFKMSLSESSHPIFLVIAWDLQDLFDVAWDSEVNQNSLVNQDHIAPLALACNLGLLQIAEWLVEKGSPVDGTEKLSRHRTFRANPLAAAITQKHSGLISMLLKAGARHTLPSDFSDRRCILAVAAEVGDLSTTKELLLRGASANGILNRHSELPLLCAVESEHAEVVHLLLEAGASPDVDRLDSRKGSYFGCSKPLERACATGNLRITEDLLDHGALVEESSEFFGTPLSSAAWNEQEAIVRLLLEKGADPNTPGDPMGNALISAASGGNVNIVSAMLQYGANLNSVFPDRNPGNALAAAIEGGRLEVFRLLLGHGADPFVRFKYEEVDFDAMDFTVAYGSTEMLTILLEQLRLVQREPDLLKMLSRALERNNTETVHFLMAQDFNPNAKSETGAMLLHRALLSSPLEIVEKLLSHGADVTLMDDEYGSVLQALCFRGYDKESGKRSDDVDETNVLFQLLLDQGASIDHGGGQLDSFLQSAGHQNRPDFIIKALELGATVRTGAGTFGGPYHASAASGHAEALEALLHFESDLDITCPPYGTALAASACCGVLPPAEMLEGLVDAGESFLNWTRCGLQDFSVRVSMPTSSDKHQVYNSIAKMLLDAGAEVNAKGGAFGNALQAAAFAGNHNLVQTLLGSGADMTVIDGIFGSALQAAVIMGPPRLALKPTPWVSYFHLSEESESLMMEPPVEYEHTVNAYEATVDVLLAAGAIVNSDGGFFDSPLQAAVQGNNDTIVKKLLEAGAAVREDGKGFYGGCISAALSFSESQRIICPTYCPEEILYLLLRHIPGPEYSETCHRAFDRALEKSNEKGLSLLREVAPIIALERGLELHLNE